MTKIQMIKGDGASLILAFSPGGRRERGYGNFHLIYWYFFEWNGFRKWSLGIGH